MTEPTRRWIYIFAIALLLVGCDESRKDEHARFLDGYWKDVTISHSHPNYILVCGTTSEVIGRVDTYEGREWFAESTSRPPTGPNAYFSKRFATEQAAKGAVESFTIANKMCPESSVKATF